MKKVSIYIFLASFFMFLCVGCANTKESTKELNLNQTSSEANDDENNIASTIPYLENNYDSLLLTDLVKESTIAELKFEEKCFVSAEEIFKLDSGYGVVLSKGDTTIKQEEVEGVEIITFPQTILERKYLLLDDNLEIKEELSLTEISPEEDSENDYQIIVSNDGNQLVWNLGDKLYYYNFESKAYGYLLEESDYDIEFEDLKFTKDDRIAFYGCRVEDGEDSTCYGIINPESSEIKLFIEKNYSASNMLLNDHYVCLTDSVEPYKDYKSSGKVLLINLETNENKVISVDGEESTTAMVTEDGKYLLAAKPDTNYQIRQYNIQSGEVIVEHTVKQDGEIKILDIQPVDNTNMYAIIFQSDKGKDFDMFECKE